jgi:2-keto-4-pentenoate hydratase/2-oxohepta-3-ene-1,7-dioic acid hydratase in catechol pathway
MKILLPSFSEPVKPAKIICIGRNYADHVKELNNAMPSEPVVFLKPSTALISSGEDIVIPPQSNDVHHEVELVIAIGLGGKNIPVQEAMKHVAGFAVGLDMTARDVQSKAKAKALPWTVAKGFDTFAPLGDFIAASEVADPQNLDIQLTINGDLRQKGNTNQMMFPLDELVSYASHIFTLEAGDLIFTGTPEGVSAIRDGDVLQAKVTGLPLLTVGVRQG